MTRHAATCLAVCLLCGVAVAQPAPAAPRGPADIISGAKKAQAAKEMADSASTAERVAPSPPSAAGGGGADPHAGVPGAPPLAPSPGAGADPHAGVPGAPPLAPSTGGAGADPHAGVPGAPPMAPKPANPHAGAAGLPARPLPSTAQASNAVPVGSIRVRVVDGQERPVPGAAIRLGIMGGNDNRSTKDAKADAVGVHVFSSLPHGEAQAYRVNVEHGGARFSSMPFRLSPDKGHEVVIRRLETTDSADAVILYVGATSVEFAEERFKVVQQVRLINITDRAYVFPADGVRIPLPEGAVSFETDKNMGHQIVEEDAGAVRITGSLEPGQATLLWGFAVPIDGAEQTISLAIPWTTFSYRVLVDDAPGLELSVDGMPAAERRSDQGRSFLVAELRRRPTDPPFSRLSIHLSGIPGPGPLRWIAALLGLLAIGLGIVVAARGRPQAPGPSPQALAQEKRALLSRARRLHNELQAGEIGPEYHAGEMAEITDELAIVLRAQANAKKSAASTTDAAPAR